ncbi:hypothetical protein IAU59_005816 [Kwoniella sp. CBS 9459]
MVTKSIACHIRVRPACDNDGKINQEGIRIEGNKVSALNVGGDRRYHFQFDKCHDVNSTQNEVFDHIRPLLEQTYKGINTTIFAYGVTGAGKTHTMQGTKADPGIIPRTVQAVFAKRSELRSTRLTVAFSYVEILKDEVYDLLGDRAEPKKRDIRMSPEGQNIVAGLIVQPINSQEEFTQIYESASETRKTASTKLNSSSSRSHAILTLYLHIQDDEDPSQIITSKICLTDLAGSENNNLTGNDRERMRESSAINTSLTTMGKVVDALNLNAQKGGEGGVFVPYRETKLTRLLQDALGGSSQGLLICCLAPGEKFARDTINTLQFGKKSKSVENRITVADPAARRHSEPIRAINPAKSFKVHENGQTAVGISNKVGSGRRTTLGSISVNTRTVSSGTAKGRDGKGVQEKENIGFKMSDEQLDQRIQKIVNQEIALFQKPAQNPVMPDLPAAMQEEAAPVPVPRTEQAVPPENNVTSRVPSEQPSDRTSVEEKEKRARVLVGHARKAHHSGDLARALDLYKKAYQYVPKNKKLALRVTEIELSLEGILPVPPPAHRQHEQAQAEIKPTGSKLTSASGMKRSRAHLGSLAELSGEIELDADMDSPAKRGRL